MSVTIDWMDARYSVIHTNFVDNWNWSELYNALESAHTLMSHSHRDITLLLDFIGSNKLSATSALFSASDSISAPQEIDRIVIVCDDTVLSKKLQKLMTDIYPHVSTIMVTHTHQEAFECVRSTMEMPALK
ncbi:MAG: hypothetical protein WBC91_11190 [Phototrophicaceae bacterium]